MRVLKRRDKLTQTLTLRVPARIKAELDQLRDRAQTCGFDLNATLRDALANTAKRVRREMDGINRKRIAGCVEGIANDSEGSGDACGRERFS